MLKPFGAAAAFAISATAMSPALVVAQAPVPGVPGAVQAGRGRGNAPTTGTGVIRGRVVAADTGLPLARAQVRLGGLPASPTSPAPSAILADDEGRYEIASLPAGRFSVSASRNGYVTLSYGQRRTVEAPRQLDLADAQVLERIDITLPRGGVIVAQVTDDFGDPMADAIVSVQQYRYGPNGRTLTNVGGTANTNDRGEARVAGLAVGDYFVTAGLSDLPRPAMLDSTRSARMYGRSFYPGTTVAEEAQRVAVAAGAETRVVFPLVPIKSARISGIVRKSDGSLPDGLIANVLTSGVVNVMSQLPLRPDGSFMIPNAKPGEVTVSVRPAYNDPSAPQEYANLRLKLTGDDISDLVITASRGATVHGRITFDSGPPPPELRPAAFRPATGSPNPAVGNVIGQTTVNDDWTFEIKGLVGSYLLRLGPQPGGGSRDWILKSVLADDKDVIDTPLELRGPQDDIDVTFVLTQRRSVITGTVADARGAAVRDYATIVFAENKERWAQQSRYIASGRPDQNGSFRIADLPPGQYFAAAIESLQTGEERDPDLLERLSRGALRFTLAEGESKTIGVRLAP